MCGVSKVLNYRPIKYVQCAGSLTHMIIMVAMSKDIYFYYVSIAKYNSLSLFFTNLGMSKSRNPIGIFCIINKDSKI